MKKALTILVAGALFLGAAGGPARAGDREWAIAGKVLAGLVVLDALTSDHCRPAVVYAPPVVYPPVVYTQPMVYTPRVVYSRPVVVQPPVRYVVATPYRPVYRPVVHPRPVYWPRSHHRSHEPSRRCGW